MRFISLFLFILSFCSVSFAQRSEQQIIGDSVIGWYTKLSEGTKPTPYQFRGQTFSVKQQELMSIVITWMQKSYIPVGGVGTFKKQIYVEENAYAPHAYGVDFRVWNVSFSPEYLDAKGHFIPVPEEYTPFSVSANMIPGSFPIYFINTPANYLFTVQTNGYMVAERLQNEPNFDPKIHPNVYKFLPWINEFHTVYLVPGNKLPIVEVTKGEYLQLAEEALDRSLQKEKEKIDRQWPGKESRDQKSRDEAYTYIKIQMDRYRNGIKQLREKYKSTLNEPAVTRNMQPDITNFDGTLDPFEITSKEETLKIYYPIYKVETDVKQKCNSDQPQWLAISFPYRTKEDGNQGYELYRAMTEHFNYDYAYDYFFNPEKVKDKPYKPANETLLNATLDTYRKKEFTKTPAVKLPSGVHLIEDFSKNAEGAKPADWYSSLHAGGGGTTVVATLNGFPGKWVQFGTGNTLSSTSLKFPLPENFTLEYDVATSEFTGRTGGNIEVEMADKKNGIAILFNLTPANGQYLASYASTALLKFRLPAGDNSTSVDYNDFSSKKRKAHIAIKKTGRQFLVFINDKQMPFLDKYKKDNSQEYLLPEGTAFNSILWRDQTNDANDKAYISNIKITKE